jgi:hypothetical protein
MFSTTKLDKWHKAPYNWGMSGEGRFALYWSIFLFLTFTFIIITVKVKSCVEQKKDAAFIREAR